MLPRIALTLIALLAMLPVAFAQSDVARSWHKAVVYLPGSARTTTIDKIVVEKPMAAAIFMHGCAGIDRDGRAWSAMLAKLGLLVVLPDSLARTDRKPSCDVVNKKGGLFPPVHGMRLDEIAHAAEQVRKQPWFDGKNLFLMGYSEGAVAAVRSKLSGFRGVIATSWTCTNSNVPAFDGVFTPAETPVLTMAHADDPWFKAPNLKGSCADKFAGRKNASHVNVPGPGHGTYDSEAAREAAAAFIRANFAGR